MKVVVTEGTGFIGANLSCPLDPLDEIDHIVAIDTFETSRRSRLDTAGEVHFEVADIRDFPSVALTDFATSFAGTLEWLSRDLATRKDQRAYVTPSADLSG